MELVTTRLNLICLVSFSQIITVSHGQQVDFADHKLVAWMIGGVVQERKNEQRKALNVTTVLFNNGSECLDVLAENHWRERDIRLPQRRSHLAVAGLSYGVLACGGTDADNNIRTECFYWGQDFVKKDRFQELKNGYVPVSKDDLDPSLNGRMVMVASTYYIKYTTTHEKHPMDIDCHISLYIPTSDQSRWPRRFFCGFFEKKNLALRWVPKTPPPIHGSDQVIPCGIFYGLHYMLLGISKYEFGGMYYNSTKDEWFEADFLQPMPLPPRNDFACTLFEKRLVINGGEWRDSNNKIERLATTSIFSFTREGWDVSYQFDLMKYGRSGHSLLPLGNGRERGLIAIGGKTSPETKEMQIEVYNHDEDPRWNTTSLKKFFSNIEGQAAAVVPAKWYKGCQVDFVADGGVRISSRFATTFICMVATGFLPPFVQ